MAFSRGCSASYQGGGSWSWGDLLHSPWCLGQAVYGGKKELMSLIGLFSFSFPYRYLLPSLPQTTAARTRQEPTVLWPSKSTCAATGTTAKPAAAPAAHPTPSARQHPAPTAHTGPAPLP